MHYKFKLHVLVIICVARPRLYAQYKFLQLDENVFFFKTKLHPPIVLSSMVPCLRLRYFLLLKTIKQTRNVYIWNIFYLW